MYCSRGPRKLQRKMSVARYRAVTTSVAQLASRTVARDQIERFRIVMAMASSSAMVTTYSGATQKSVRIIESEDEDSLALSLNPLANILVTKLLNLF